MASAVAAVVLQNCYRDELGGKAAIDAQVVNDAIVQRVQIIGYVAGQAVKNEGIQQTLSEACE